MINQILSILKISALALVLSIGLSYAFAAWAPPTELPPNGNADAPINVGDTTQTKIGGDICTSLGGGVCLSTAGGGSSLPSGVAGQTLRNVGGTNWATSSLLFNTGTNVGIGTTTPSYLLDLALSLTGGTPKGVNVYNSVGGSVGTVGYNLGLKNTTADASGHLSLERTTGTAYLGMEMASQSRDGFRLMTGATTPSEVLRVTANGNVGIGTTTPAYKLDVNGTIRAGASALLSTGGPAGFYQDATNGAYRAIVGPTNNTGFYFQTNTGAATTMFVGLGGPYNGSVGIGTTTPGAKLDVNGDINAVGTISTQGGSTNYYGIGSIPMTSTTANDLDSTRPNRVSSQIMRINNHVGISMSAHSYYGGIRFYNQGYSGSNTNPYDSTIGAQLVMSIINGNVGIGTTNPTKMLDVAGAAKIDTSLQIGANPVNIGKTYKFTVDSDIQIGSISVGSGNGGAISNVAMGNGALSNTTMGGNVALGMSALYRDTAGGANVGIGVTSLFNTTTGSGNIGIGYNAGSNNTTGTYNTALGYGANVSTGALTNATAIGNGATVTVSNRIRLGNTSVGLVESYGSFSQISDARQKENVADYAHGLDFITKLRPVTFTMKEDTTKVLHSGFIAQEVEATGIPFYGLNKPANEKDFYSLSYAEFVVPLVNSVKELKAENDELSSRVEKLEAENDALLSRIEKIEEKLK